VPVVDKVWRLLPAKPEEANRLAREAKLPVVVAQLLINRGITNAKDAQRFLNAPLAALHSPALLPHIPLAAVRVHHAIVEKRKICIYGDYDVDGVTGTAILLKLLTHLGADVMFHVPLRLSEGYGLNSERLGELAKQGVSQVISVDCGIASLDEAAEAKRLGLELIVTDHHEMKTKGDAALLPDAAVLVHPRLPGSTYPFGGLSGAGVAFKLAWAVAQQVSGTEKVRADLRELLLDCLGLAALGLIADIVPLQDENRIFVRNGLQRILDKPSVGLSALIAAAQLGTEKPLTTDDVGFRLAPRLNAAGRLGCASLAVELLTTRNEEKAKKLAEYLEGQNRERQSVERKITGQAKEMMTSYDLAATAGIVLGSPDWHQGVVGIVASRMVETYARPALVVSIKNDEHIAVGSGRSVPGFALHLALKACEEHLIGHGGHAAAAGFKLLPENLDAFSIAFNAYAVSQFPNGIPPAPRLTLDTEIPLSAISWGLLRDIDKLEPYGAQNPKPRFLAAGVKVENPRAIGSGDVKRHLDFKARQGAITFRCVGWNMADRLEELQSAGGDVCIAFTPRGHEWNDFHSIQLVIHDFKPGITVDLE
jgi:single-stranded-DNA-specific exonuclease